MAPHCSTLAWKIPWMEEPGRLQSRGSQRVGHGWVTSLSLFTFLLWRRKWQPTPVFLPGESQGWGAWWAAVYGVTQSQTRLKRLSSSSSRNAPTSQAYHPFAGDFERAFLIDHVYQSSFHSSKKKSRERGLKLACIYKNNFFFFFKNTWLIKTEQLQLTN